MDTNFIKLQLFFKMPFFVCRNKVILREKKVAFLTQMSVLESWSKYTAFQLYTGLMASHRPTKDFTEHPPPFFTFYIPVYACMNYIFISFHFWNCNLLFNFIQLFCILDLAAQLVKVRWTRVLRCTYCFTAAWNWGTNFRTHTEEKWKL